MTTETPCVAGCINAEFHDEYHRPNAPKPAEPKPCHICGQEQSKHIGPYRACPVFSEPQGCIICGNVLTEGGEPYCWDHQPEPPACGACMEWDPSCEDCRRSAPPQDAEPPACKCRHEKSAHCTECSAGCGCDSYEPQGSEPPMGRIEASERAMHANDRRMLDAYRADNAALKARAERLESVVLRANAGRFNGSVIGTEARAIRAELERSSEDLAEARLFTSLQTAALENRNEELAIAKAEIGRLEELLLEWADHGSSDDLLGEARAIRARKEASNGK